MTAERGRALTVRSHSRLNLSAVWLSDCQPGKEPAPAAGLRQREVVEADQHPGGEGGNRRRRRSSPTPTAPLPVCVLGLQLGPLPASLIIAVSMARASARAGRPHAHRHQMFSARSSRPSRWSRERVLCAGSAGARLHIVVEMSAPEHRLQPQDDSRAPVAHMASQWQARLPESLNGVEGSAL